MSETMIETAEAEEYRDAPERNDKPKDDRSDDNDPYCCTPPGGGGTDPDTKP